MPFHFLFSHSSLVSPLSKYEAVFGLLYKLGSPADSWILFSFFSTGFLLFCRFSLLPMDLHFKAATNACCCTLNLDKCYALYYIYIIIIVTYRNCLRRSNPRSLRFSFFFLSNHVKGHIVCPTAYWKACINSKSLLKKWWHQFSHTRVR